MAKGLRRSGGEFEFLASCALLANRRPCRRSSRSRGLPARLRDHRSVRIPPIEVSVLDDTGHTWQFDFRPADDYIDIERVVPALPQIHLRHGGEGRALGGPGCILHVTRVFSAVMKTGEEPLDRVRYRWRGAQKNLHPEACSRIPCLGVSDFDVIPS
jgi:hypothetical protein